MPKTSVGSRSDVEAQQCATRLAAALTADEPALLSSLDFGPHVTQGDGGGARIIIGDQSEIPLLDNPARPVLDHRMALLADRGDMVVLHTPDAGFQSYVADVLGRRGIKWLAAGGHPTDAVAKICRTEAQLFDPLRRFVADAGGATIQSYLTTGNTWRLAQALGTATGQIVHVAGPAPRIARRANDKLWFSDLARRVLGHDAVPPTMYAYGPAAAAGLVRQLARDNAQVIIKVPDSAGSNGNIRLESADIGDASLHLLCRFLRRHLNIVGWQGRYPLLVGIWESDVVCSPSVQMWLPKVGEGLPRIEGVFEQRVCGIGAAFVGAERSTLPGAVQARLGSEALAIAAVLQRLGYFGQCSFDAVLVQKNDKSLIPHWIECNGRWGGVSIPMTVAADLLEGALPDGLVIVQTPMGRDGFTTSHLRNCLEPLLFRPGQSTEGIVILAPPLGGDDPSLTLMALAQDQIGATRLMDVALARLRI
ncbi:hypothetical protein ACP2AV_01245 [Aliiroseovarius sp. PTFE2010]|uniref:preATP grasp domain-containing protein n=1 Tax=Aliiroseovarius sp. PTFE2010 TaxID=3417190 RepID=UPI003CF7F295